MRKPSLLLLFLLIFSALLSAGSPPATVSGERYYDFNGRAVGIYDDILALELKQAQTDLDAFKSTNPSNLAAEHLESYLDFFRLYLTGNQRLDEDLQNRFDERQEALAAGSADDPYFRYAQAENYLHRSLMDIRFNRHLAAFRHLNRANKLLRENAKLFPDFLLNYKDLGLLHAAVGSIPSSYKWGVELFTSLNGTIAEGQAEMQRALLDTDSPFHLETAVLSAFLELHLADNPARAYQMVNDLELEPSENALHCFVRANLAMHHGYNDEALRILENQPRGGTTADFPYLDFMLGLAKIRSLDPLARIHFQSYNSRFIGRHFKEEARQKIAWSYLLQGNEDAYRETILRIEGGGRAGGDENAAREAITGLTPHLGLLRARLLFDGNYCTRARAELDAIDRDELNENEQLELLYRTGRVLEGLEDYEGALSFYAQTVNDGRENPAYFACKAALQAGLVEEKRGNETAAAQHFETCLNISPAEYRTGLHILANAGLNRVQ